MHILSVENLSKSYGEQTLFSNVGIGIETGDKIGLLGINGAGKTTFLRLIANEEIPDTGRIITAGNVTIEYLPQEPKMDDQATVLEQVFKGSSKEMVLLRAYQQTIELLAQQPANQSLQAKVMVQQEQMDALDVWQLESEAKIILTKLGISDFLSTMNTLSGGQRKRVALASALIGSADLLILDEPTNHIDNEVVVWLEQYLANRQGALLMVTHDRYFLDRVSNRILEIDGGKLYSYAGNYATFLEAKALREEQAQIQSEKTRNLYRQELSWMRQGARARTTKQKARIERFNRLQEEVTPQTSTDLDLRVGYSRLGKQIIEIEGISKSFPETLLIRDFTYTVLRNDRIGIVGPNGSGKTTLLNMLAGELRPDEGDITLGKTVKIGYFSQDVQDIDENQRVIDYITDKASVITTVEAGKVTASQMLERFLFPPDVQWKPLHKLSGGEKRRLYLLKVLMGAPNILLLDEPTNDLDVYTLSVLEAYLDSFAGAVIAVSHDRYFLDRVVHKLFAFMGEGKILQLPGNYSHNENRFQEDVTRDQTKALKAVEKIKPPLRKRRKLSYNEQREYEKIDDVIVQLEQALIEVNRQVAKASTDHSLLHQLSQKQQVLEKQLEETLDRWVYLSELVEGIEG